MPMAAVTLKPGVDVQKTLSANEAGISVSQMIRFKTGLTQTMGGWRQFSISTVPSTVRDLHPWEDILGTARLGIGATHNLAIATATSYSDITPTTYVTNPVPDFSISSANNVITVVDPNSGVVPYTTVVFETPIAIGNLLLDGAHQVGAVLSTGSFTIISSISPSTTIASSGILPVFTTTAGSATVQVDLPNHGWVAISGIKEDFIPSTVVDGLTIQGEYQIGTVTNSSVYTIMSPTISSAAATATMNNGNARLRYYQAVGPGLPGFGFGAGPFGGGGFGTGSGGGSGTMGTNIVSSDWSLDNWGEILLACQADGPIFQWSPDEGFVQARVIANAPLASGGIFVSMPLQILVAWASTQTHGHGIQHGVQDPLTINWSDQLDFENWDVSNQTVAGSFHIPTGSRIIGGLQAPNYGVISTDIDLWIMQYVGGEAVFNFTRVGSGCGWISQHAAGVIANEVYWCGYSNFFKLSANGVETIPCTVWDYIFQNINRAYAYKIRCAPNSMFHEIAWHFPSANATENDSYVKLNIIEGTWDFGLLTRTAWTDVSVLGQPIGSDTGGFLYQHESGNSINGSGNPSFQTGWWAIAEGEELGFVDYVIPDFIWGTYGTNASAVDVTFFSADYPGDTPVSYGPYTVTQTTQYINTRIRGRLMSMEVKSNSNDEFWRIGRVRFRWAPSGRR